MRISVIHRLAVFLNRNRSTRELPRVDFNISGELLRLEFPDEWLSSNPLTVADLDREKKYLADVDVVLEYS